MYSAWIYINDVIALCSLTSICLVGLLTCSAPWWRVSARTLQCLWATQGCCENLKAHTSDQHTPCMHPLVCVPLLAWCDNTGGCTPLLYVPGCLTGALTVVEGCRLSKRDEGRPGNAVSKTVESVWRKWMWFTALPIACLHAWTTYFILPKHVQAVTVYMYTYTTLLTVSPDTIIYTCLQVRSPHRHMYTTV